ncbi:MAG: RNA polymerase sigma factor [Acidobacteriota bacterium]
MQSLLTLPILAVAAVTSRAGPAASDVSAGASDATRLDQAAFRIFYDQTAAGLRRYLQRVCHDPERADDLVQDSYIRLLHRSDLDLDPKALRAYLYRTATNLLRDQWRRDQRERRGLERWLVEWRERLSVAPSEPADDLATALAQLPARDRAMLWLAHVEGWSHQEIADQFDLRPASIKVLLFRLRRRLADQLRPDGGAP